ncbi:MAG: hypothetical protein LCI00_20180 [Chloroflexi bacterium]|nr:hypothetical protein [Chloroflexota bacterium]
MSDDELRTALQGLLDDWAAQAQKAARQGQQIGMSNIQQSFYQRGLAEGFKRAHIGLKTLLETPQVEEVPVQPVETVEYERREHEAVLALLIRTGISTNDLHSHSDNSYSVFLSMLQSVRADELMEKLAAEPYVIVLAHGKLPNSNKVYIDFAFRPRPPR